STSEGASPSMLAPAPSRAAASSPPPPVPQEPAPATASGRFVVRRATIELESPDVTAAFLTAARVVRPARGEYVQESSDRGEGSYASASRTLRIAADRLSEALHQLRALGTVTSETTSGEDITTQMVDLEARLRNERRIEVELL